MKVPPKRKGNTWENAGMFPFVTALNESPSEKEGKCSSANPDSKFHLPSMKVPPKRKGNVRLPRRSHGLLGPQ